MYRVEAYLHAQADRYMPIYKYIRSLLSEANNLWCNFYSGKKSLEWSVNWRPGIEAEKVQILKGRRDGTHTSSETTHW